SDAEAAGLGLAFYAFILGYALAEAEGLLRPISAQDEAELRSLDPLACPATLALIPAFKALDRDAAFDASVDAFIDGVACRVQGARAAKRVAARSVNEPPPLLNLRLRQILPTAFSPSPIFACRFALISPLRGPLQRPRSA